MTERRHGLDRERKARDHEQHAEVLHDEVDVEPPLAQLANVLEDANGIQADREHDGPRHEHHDAVHREAVVGRVDRCVHDRRLVGEEVDDGRAAVAAVILKNVALTQSVHHRHRLALRDHDVDRIARVELARVLQCGPAIYINQAASVGC